MSVAEAFKKHGVVPDVVPHPPSKLVKAVYDSGVEVSMAKSTYSFKPIFIFFSLVFFLVVLKVEIPGKLW